MTRVTDLYDDLADDYDGRYTRSTDVAENAALRRALTPLCDGKAVLDLACGTGLVWQLTDPATYIGVDGAFRALKHAVDLNFVKTGTGDVIEADLDDWKLPALLAGTFDVVTCTFAAHYLSLPRTLQLARDALRPGGRIFLHGQGPRYETRKHYVLYGVRHDHRRWIPGPSRLSAERAGFSDVETVGFNGAWDPITDRLPPVLASAALALTSRRKARHHYHFALTGRKGSA